MYRSAVEIKSDNVTKMGESLGALYSELWQELANLHFDWSEYVVLFGTKPERIDLLNQTAGGFFQLVEDSLWEKTLLNICRLVDPHKTAGKPNLSIQRLAHEISDSIVKTEIGLAIEIALSKCAFAIDWRHRRIAHNDLGLALGYAEPLTEASRFKVKEAISSISAVLDVISMHYLNVQLSFEFLSTTGSAIDLLYLLKDGLRLREERRQRIEIGEYLPTDFQGYDV